jgi:hypothetical protein
VSAFAPPTGRGRCPLCGHHVRTQGHRSDCVRGGCRRCGKFPKMPGRRNLCAWCVADDDTRRELRRQAVADKLADLDGGDR